MRFTPQMRDLAWLVARPIAHRGKHDRHAGVLENSSTAFTQAVNGNYAIECDVQVTKEGEAIVFHDESLQRLTTSEGLVREHSVKQLQRMSYRIGNDRMQTLGEMLDQVAGKVPLVIELKSHWNRDETLALRALKVLEKYDGPYCLMSFDPDMLTAIAEHSPKTVRGIVADRVTNPSYKALPLDRRIELRSFSHLPRTLPHFVSFYFRELPFAPVQQIRAQGHPVITWTIRSEEQALQARRYSDQITFEGYAA